MRKCKVKELNYKNWVEIVAQLAERLLLSPEVRSLNPVIEKFLCRTFIYCQLYWKDENKEKRAVNVPTFTNNLKHFPPTPFHQDQSHFLTYVSLYCKCLCRSEWERDWLVKDREREKVCVRLTGLDYGRGRWGREQEEMLVMKWASSTLLL